MLLAHAQLFGVFNFDQTPLAPLGIRVMVHERVGQRMSWGDHGKEGWYTGPALQHYRNYTMYVKETNSERTSNTVEFFPSKLTMPATGPTDRLIAATEEHTDAIANPRHASPFLFHSNDEQTALAKLASLLTTTTSSPTPVSPPRVDATPS